MNDHPRVLVTRIIPDAGLDLVREAADAEVWPDELPPPRDVLLRKVQGIEGLLSLLTDRVDDELLDDDPDGSPVSQDRLVTLIRINLGGRAARHRGRARRLLASPKAADRHGRTAGAQPAIVV